MDVAEEEATYLKHTIDFRYNNSRKHIKLYSHKTLLNHSNQTKLVPIRLELEHDGVKLRDFFTWNLFESLMTPEEFASILCEDFDCPQAKEFLPLISESIRTQVLQYSTAVEEDLLAPVIYELKTEEKTKLDTKKISNDNSVAVEKEESNIFTPDIGSKNATPDATEVKVVEKEQIPSYGDIRILIKLDLHVGSLFLKDQFEWPLFEHSITPEEFASILSADLGISGEFLPLIAHSIREQVCIAR